jgi:hypothetical protein
MIAVAIEVPPLRFTAMFANQWKLYSRVRVGDSRERSTIFSSRIHRSNNEQKSQIPGGHEISNALALLACLFFWLFLFEFLFEFASGSSGSICVCSQIL